MTLCKFNLDCSFSLHFCCLRPQKKFAVMLEAEEEPGSSGEGELQLFCSSFHSGFCSEAAGASWFEPPSASSTQPLHSPPMEKGLPSAPSQSQNEGASAAERCNPPLVAFLRAFLSGCVKLEDGLCWRESV